MSAKSRQSSLSYLNVGEPSSTMYFIAGTHSAMVIWLKKWLVIESSIGQSEGVFSYTVMWSCL